MEDQALVEGSVVFKDEEGPVGDGPSAAPGAGVASAQRRLDGTSQGGGRARSVSQGAPRALGWPAPWGRVPVSLLRPAASQARSPTRGRPPRTAPNCGPPPARSTRHTPAGRPKGALPPPAPGLHGGPVCCPASLNEEALPSRSARATRVLTLHFPCHRPREGTGGGRCHRNRHFRLPHPSTAREAPARLRLRPIKWLYWGPTKSNPGRRGPEAGLTSL